jgi:hypothetical protein
LRARRQSESIDKDTKPGDITGNRVIRSKEGPMAVCEHCGNDYDKSFQVVMSGKTHNFDSFECAIHALAPSCAHCGVRIVGHGLEKDGTFYCCDHCAEAEGVSGLRDRV